MRLERIRQVESDIIGKSICRHLHWMRLCIIFAVFIPITGSGQSINGYIAYPQDQGSGISVQPAIRIVANYPIDTTSISGFTQGLDSTYNEGIDQNFYVVDRLFYSLSDSSRYRQYCRLENITMVSDSILEFTPSELMPGTEYVIVVRNIRVDSCGSSVNMHIDTCMFRTEYPANYLDYTSFVESNELMPIDTFAISFGYPLEDVTVIGGEICTGFGPIVQLMRVVHSSIDTVQGNIIDSLAPVDISSSLDSDNRTIRARIVANLDSIHYGDLHYVVINGQYLTGDTNSCYKKPINIMGGYRIKVIACDTVLDKIDHPLIAYPLKTRYCEWGDTVKIFCAEGGKGYSFMRWETNDISFVNGNTNQGLQWCPSPYDLQPQLNASRIAEVKLSAMYSNIALSQCTINDASNGITKVVNLESLDEVVSSGTSIARKDESYGIVAVPDSGFVFSHWESSFQELDNYTENTIVFTDTIGTIESLTPVFAPIQSPPTQPYSVSARFFPIKGADVYSIAQITPANFVTGFDPDSMVTFDVDIMPEYSDYFITRIVDLREGATDSIISYGAHSIQAHFTLKDLYNGLVHFEVAPLHYDLNIKATMVDPLTGSYVPSKNTAYTSYRLDFSSGIVPPNDPEPDGSVTYKVPYGETVYFHASGPTNDHIYFEKWEDGFPNHYFPVPSTNPVWSLDFTESGLNYPATPFIDVVARYLPEFRLVSVTYDMYDESSGAGQVNTKTIVLNDNMLQELKDGSLNVLVPSTPQGVTSKVTFNFTHPIDRTSIQYYSQGINLSSYNFIGRDNGQRLDYELYLPVEINRKFFYFPNDPSNPWIPFSNFSFSNGDMSVEFILRSLNPCIGEEIVACRYLPIDFFIKGGQSGIKSTQGEIFPFDYVVKYQTELPAVRWSMPHWKCIGWDGDDWPRGAGEWFLFGVSGVDKGGPSAEVTTKIQYPLGSGSGTIDDVDEGEWHNLNPPDGLLLYSDDHVDIDDYIGVALAGYEEDSSNVKVIVEGILDAVAAFVPTEFGGDWLKPFVTAIKKIAGDDELWANDDDKLGEYSVRFGKEEWWGYRPSARARLEQYVPNIVFITRINVK